MRMICCIDNSADLSVIEVRKMDELMVIPERDCTCNQVSKWKSAVFSFGIGIAIGLAAWIVALYPTILEVVS